MFSKVGGQVGWQVGMWVGRFFGQVMSPHHSDQMSQRSQVSRIAHLRCSLNVFVFVIVFVFVFVIVSVFLLVWTCLLIPLIKCLKGHKSLGSLCRLVKTLIVTVSGNRPRDKVSY